MVLFHFTVEFLISLSLFRPRCEATKAFLFQIRTSIESKELIDHFILVDALTSCLNDREIAEFGVEELRSATNMTLLTASENLLDTFGTDNNGIETLMSRLSVSFKISDCSTQLNDNRISKEYFYHTALAMSPWNVYSAKQLAYNLEWMGKIEMSESLLLQSFNITHDFGVLLQYSFACSSIFNNRDEAYEGFMKIIKKSTHAMLLYHDLISASQNSNSSLFCIPTDFHIYFSFVTSNFRYLENQTINQYCADPYMEIYDVSLNFQYNGYSPNLLSQLYTKLLQLLFQQSLSYHNQYISLSPPTHIQQSSNNIINFETEENKSSYMQMTRIRIGIVSEHDSNSSPGLCLTTLFDYIIKQQQSCMEHTINENTNSDQNCHDINQVLLDFIFFGRPDSITYFAHNMKKISQKHILLNVNDPYQSSLLIRNENIDILIYIALPTEKFSLIMSMFRLAPIQIQYGIGHPLSSGSTEIDYSIMSSLMTLDYSLHTQAMNCHSYMMHESISTTSYGYNAILPSDSKNNIQILNCHSHINEGGRDTKNNNVDSNTTSSSISMAGQTCHCGQLGTFSSPSVTYSEQLVLFNSIGYYLDDPLYFYEHLTMLRDDPLQFISTVSCATLNNFLLSLKLSVNMTAESLGCENHTKSIHLYMCIQPLKKMHPIMDQAFANILENDNNAKILLYNTNKNLFIRWKSNANILSNYNLQDRFVFVPRLAHENYLILLVFSDVFLGTFPFGAGITSSEAIALCVPPIILPSMTSVIQFTLAQLRVLSMNNNSNSFEQNIHYNNNNNDYDFETMLSSNSITEYAQKAIYYASKEHNQIIRRKICNSKYKLFGKQNLKTVAQEWVNFLENVYNNQIK